MKHILIAAALCASPAFSQDIDDFTACGQISDDTARLSCFDAALAVEDAVEPEVASDSAWIVEVETSRLKDTTDVYLSVESDEKLTCGTPRDTAILHLRCKENTTSIIMASNCFVSTRSGLIDYRIDQDEAQEKAFSASNNNYALGLWRGRSAIPFIKNMLGGETMIVRFSPLSDSTQTVTFPIAGLDEAIKPLRESCGW